MSKEYKGWVGRLAEHTEDIEIVPQGHKTDDIDVIVCRLKTEPLLLPDNLLGHCCKCFRLVQFRPHIPREPKRMCDDCAGKDLDARRKAGEELKFVITENTARDVDEFLRKRKMQ